jgi:hypothetical protein
MICARGWARGDGVEGFSTRSFSPIATFFAAKNCRSLALAASNTMIGPVRAADRRMNRFGVGTLNQKIIVLTDRLYS